MTMTPIVSFLRKLVSSDVPSRQIQSERPTTEVDTGSVGRFGKNQKLRNPALLERMYKTDVELILRSLVKQEPPVEH